MTLQWLRNCVEIPVLLAFFGFLLSAPITANFIIYRTCYVTLGFNETECARLGTADADNETQVLEELVQPYSNVMSMTQSALTQIVPAFLCLVIGPWSDKNGRRPMMVVTFAGFILRGIVTVIVALFKYASPWYLLIGNIPAAFAGGLAPLMTLVLCYATDITTEENRGTRMTVIDAAMATGMLLGTLSSAYVFELGGYVAVYGVEMACNIVSCLYCYFVISETVTPIDSDDQGSTSIFSLKNVSVMFRTTFYKRENYGRAFLLFTVGLSTISVLVMAADASIIFMFLREKFHWNLEHYTLFSSISSLAGIAGTVIGIVLLHKLLKISELPLMVLGLFSYISSAIVQGIGYMDWHIYLASGVRSLYGIVSPMCRTLISKLLTKEETGKIFAIAIFVDSLVVMIGGPVYTLIYNFTITTNPGAFNFVSAGLLGISVILACIMIVLQKKVLRGHSYETLPSNIEAE